MLQKNIHIEDQWNIKGTATLINAQLKENLFGLGDMSQYIKKEPRYMNVIFMVDLYRSK